MTAKLYIGSLAALIWVAAIIGKHFWPDLDTGAITLACGSVLSGLGVYHVSTPGDFVTGTLGQIADSTAKTATLASRAEKSNAAMRTEVGGFASVRLLAIVAAIAIGMSLLAGCTTTTASMYSGLYTQAKAGVQVFDDNTLTTMKDLVCAQPYSAIQRHPELQAGIVTLCGPMANIASIDPAQVMQMLAIAKQLGLAPGAPATAASGPK